MRVDDMEDIMIEVAEKVSVVLKKLDKYNKGII